jgi:hypothetical protein
LTGQSVVQEITCVKSLMSSMGDACKQMVVQPKSFFTGLSFRLTFAVHFGTHSVANLSEAALDCINIEDEPSGKFWKVGCASMANVDLLAWRDSVFAREFSGSHTKKPAKAPVRTVSLFAARDTVTMGATFYAAPRFCKFLVH